MNVNTLKVSLLLFIALSFSGLHAQQTPPTVERSLDELIQLALQNNQQIRLARYNQSLAATDYEQSKAIYLPQVQASLTGTVTNLPLNAFGTLLNHGAVEQADFAPSALNEPDGIDNLQTRLQVLQPVLNLDGRAKRKAAGAMVKVAEQQLTRSEAHISFELTKAYLQLQMAYQAQEVLEQARTTAQANLKLVKDNFDVGYVQQVDVLSVEIRISEIDEQLLQTQLNIQNASDGIYFLLGQAPGQLIYPTDTIQQTAPEQTDSLQLNARSDFAALQAGIEARTFQLEAAENANLPRVNAFASYEFNNKLSFEDGANGYLIGIQASWDIFKGGILASQRNKAQLELEKAQLQYEQYRDQSALQLQQASRKQQHAREQIKLSEALIKQATEKLRIKTNRFRQGMEKTTDLLNAEVELAQKRLQLQQAIFNNNMANAEINFLLEQ